MNANEILDYIDTYKEKLIANGMGRSEANAYMLGVMTSHLENALSDDEMMKDIVKNQIKEKII